MRAQPAALLLLPLTACGALLRPDAFEVQVASEPAGAAVVYEGAEVGRTPCRVVVTRRSHRFDLRLPGHRTRRVDCGTVRNDWVLANVLTLGVGAFVDHLLGADRDPDDAPIRVQLGRGEPDVIVPWLRVAPMQVPGTVDEPGGLGVFVATLLQSAFGWWNGTAGPGQVAPPAWRTR